MKKLNFSVTTLLCIGTSLSSYAQEFKKVSVPKGIYTETKSGANVYANPCIVSFLKDVRFEPVEAGAKLNQPVFDKLRLTVKLPTRISKGFTKSQSVPGF